MKRFTISGLVAAMALSMAPISAVDVSLSSNNLRLSNTSPSTSFTASLNDNIDKLTGSGTIKAKLRVKSKNIELSSKTIEIPYTDGVIGDSEAVTLSLKEAEITQSSSAKLSIKFPKKYKKKFKIKNFKTTVSLDAQAPKVSGQVSIPSGNLASFKSKTRSKLRNKGITPFNLENPDGVLVELIEIDSTTGEKVGDTLASALTDSEGEFELDLPEAVDFGTEHVLVVEGEEPDEAMHAPLSSDEVDVNPATEVIFDLTQEAILAPEEIGLDPLEPVSFESFTELEAEGLNERLEELNPVFEETLAESLAGIRATYEDYLDTLLAHAADDDEAGVESDLAITAKGVAGDYNVVFFDSVLTSEDSVNSSVQLTSGRMFKPDEVGALVVKPGVGFQTSMRSFETNSSGPEGPGEGPDDGGQNSEDDSASCYDVESESFPTTARNADEQGNFYMTIDANRIISFAEASFTEFIDNPDGRYVFTTQPSVMNMIPVGDNMFLSSSLSIGELTRPDGVVETEYSTGFGSIIKKANLEEGSITGAYGLVGLGYMAGSSHRGAVSFVGDINFAADAIDYNLTSVQLRQNNFGCSGSSIAVEVQEETITGTGKVKYQGDRVSINVDEEEDDSMALFTGFATSDKEILTLAYAADFGIQGSRGNSNVVNDAERQMIFAVKKPSSQLDLSGKTYRLISLNFSFNDQGGKSVAAGELGTLTFSASTVSLADFTKTVYDLASAGATVTTASSVETQTGIAYTLSETGSIAFTVGSEELTGYVSSDARLIILNSDKDAELGTYLAVEQ